ncbi:MAG: hypothetical protein MUF83_06000 [Acidimicrobiales bacterium]|jgi:methionyl-tRNA formyltransferase|nr:hypothetical protein [Acidimicrobiales bacterium]
MPARPPAHPRRLVFLGTPAPAVPPLRALVEVGHDVALVVSGADKRRGRGSGRSPSPVKAAALELGLPVAHDVDAVLDVGADLGVVVAFGRIIRPHVLDALPMVNLHFSLLPRWRGAAPVERAVLAGDRHTGVDVMAVEEELDTGAVYAESRLDIGPDETVEELRARLVDAGTELLIDTLATGLGVPRPQQGEVTYAEKIRPEELALDWGRTAEHLHRVVRLGNAWTTFRGRRLKVWRAHVQPEVDLAPGTLQGTTVGTARGGLELVEVQPEGKPRQAATAWRNGARPDPGELLGS